MAALHIENIRDNFNKGNYTVRLQSSVHKVAPDYVFDENLSVRRNRELVKEHNQKVDEQRAFRLTKQAELDKQLTEDVVDYIKEYYELDDRQARMVERWVYQEKHSFMCDYFSSIDTFAEFAEDLINSTEA